MGGPGSNSSRLKANDNKRAGPKLPLHQAERLPGPNQGARLNHLKK